MFGQLLIGGRGGPGRPYKLVEWIELQDLPR